MKWILCYLLVLSTLCVIGKEIRLLDVIVPERMFVKSDVLLQCIFELKSPTELYSVTWYKDNNEFYRFLPRDIPPARAFPLPGVTVDLEASDEQKVMLRGLETFSSGVFLCEVSAEAPVFHTVAGQGTLKVCSNDAYHPELAVKPRISGLRGLYSINDTVSANCTLPTSQVTYSTIEWFVNDVKALPHMTIDYSQQMKQENIKILGLKLIASNITFPDRVLNLRCVVDFGSRKEEQHRWIFLVNRTRSSGGWGWQSSVSIPRPAYIFCLLAVVTAVPAFS